MAILTQNEQARSALLKSGLDLSRNEQQRREDRDEFWTRTITPLFNNPNTELALSFRGIIPNGDYELDTIDVCKASEIQRSGTLLKEKYFCVRSHFTRSFSSWTV